MISLEMHPGQAVLHYVCVENVYIEWLVLSEVSLDICVSKARFFCDERIDKISDRFVFKISTNTIVFSKNVNVLTFFSAFITVENFEMLPSFEQFANTLDTMCFHVSFYGP